MIANQKRYVVNICYTIVTKNPRNESENRKNLFVKAPEILPQKNGFIATNIKIPT